MTLLTIVQDASVLAGLPKPSYVVASNDPGTVAIFAMVNQIGRELMRKHTWQALQTEKTFTTLAQAEQTGAIEADFDRFINETMFNRTQNRRVYGPLSAQEWQQRQAGSFAGVTDYYRQRGDAIIMSPTPTAGDTVAYEYISKFWVTGDKVAMTADADTAILDENLLTLGATWRYLKSKGMDYAEDFRTYEIEVANAIAKDGGKATVDFGVPSSSYGPVPPRLYDGQLISEA